MKHLLGFFVVVVCFLGLCLGFCFVLFKFQHGCSSPSASNHCTADMDGFLIHFPLQVAVEM